MQVYLSLDSCNAAVGQFDPTGLLRLSHFDVCLFLCFMSCFCAGKFMEPTCPLMPYVLKLAAGLEFRKIRI